MKFLFRSIALLIAIASTLLYRSQLYSFALDQLNQYYYTTTGSDTRAATAESLSDVAGELEDKHLSPQGFSSSSKLREPEEQLVVTEMSVHRAIRKVFLAVEQAEGQGARVRRSVGTPALRNFSPFLMLDHFSIKPGAGFPDQ